MPLDDWTEKRAPWWKLSKSITDGIGDLLCRVYGVSGLFLPQQLNWKGKSGKNCNAWKSFSVGPLWIRKLYDFGATRILQQKGAKCWKYFFCIGLKKGSTFYFAPLFCLMEEKQTSFNPCICCSRTKTINANCIMSTCSDRASNLLFSCKNDI